MRASLALLAALAALLLLAPLFAGGYLLSIMILALFAAYLGQAWNIMMGFAGLLSLGHALYVGLGAYAGAALFVRLGVTPWAGLLAGMALAALVGGAIAALGFRFRVAGVHFALLTIAFAEFTRILFDHVDWVGGSSGLFIPVGAGAGSGAADLWHLRGPPIMFYYLALALTAAALALSHQLKRRRIGFYWQAIREDPDAAQALGIDLFRYRLAAVMLSAAMSAAAGTFQAFYTSNLYPETVFAMSRSVELIAAPIIGGLGTLFGPILGAFVLAGLGEATGALTQGAGLDGIKQWCYGAALLAIVALRPGGLWPWLYQRLVGPRP